MPSKPSGNLLTQTLSNREARLASILDTAVESIITIDAEGTIISFNKAAERMFSHGADEVIGENVALLAPSPHRENHDGYIASFLRTGEKKIIGIGREILALRKDGTTFPAQLSVSDFQSDGQTMFTGIVRDISDQKEAEKAREELIIELEQKKAKEELIIELEQKNAEMERFIYTVSHDLKSPLISIQGFMGLLKKDISAGDAERIESDIRQVVSAAGIMQQLLDDVLELSRIGRLINPPHDVSLKELAIAVSGLMAGPIEERGVRLDISPDLPVLFGDRVRLLEVLQNLIENAIKYMGDQTHPHIEIGTRREGAKTVCFVQDNGSGIDPSYHEKVFGLFERLSKEKEGTGIGLALVKRIVEVHGGRIWVESEGQGKGSTFCFVLPEKGEMTSR